MLSVMTVFYSCEKKEPEKQPAPDEIMKKISEKFPEISEPAVSEIYLKDKDKIEKYSVIKEKENSAAEIGIFKLYDKINADYVKDKAQAEILKMQEKNSDTDLLKILNDAEIRSYGNYVYYVSHAQKDKIFKIIENALRGG